MKHFYILIFVLFSFPLLMQGQADSLRANKPKISERKKAFDPETVFVTFQEADDLHLDKVGEWMERNLKGAEYKAAEQNKPDALGCVHATYQQVHQGIEVENGLITVHSKNGKVTTINGKLPQVALPSNLTVALTEDAAKSALLQYVAAKSYMKTDYPVALLIAKDHQGNYRLAYKIRIDASEPFMMNQYYVDAQTGAVFKTIPLIEHINTPATANTKYSGIQTITTDSYSGGYLLQESGVGVRNIQTLDGSHATLGSNGFLNTSDFVDSDTIWTNTLESLVVTSANQNWWYAPLLDVNPDLYIIIIDATADTVYISDTKMDTNTPITFSNINLALSNPPYSVIIMDDDLGSGDDYGGTYSLTTMVGTNNFSDTNCSGNYLASMVHPALDVHWGVEKTYDFYVDKFGRHSFDGNNSLIQNYVGVPPNAYPGFGLPNQAFVPPAPYDMLVFGNGDGQTYGPVVGLDILGHEYTHLVIRHNGFQGLENKGESGALNESFADIFGTAIEFYSKPTTANWEIGEQVILTSPFYLRSMSNPNSSQSPQPKTYGDTTYWKNPNDTTFDNGGVHINSGVQNFWFYLVSQGGNGTNSLGNIYNVTGVGIDKASRIAYYNLTTYLTSKYAKYYDACLGSLNAAEDLYGNPSAEYSAVFNAWYAVGVLDAPVNFTVNSGVTTFQNILNWDYQYNSSACDYQIERKTGINGTFSLIGIVTSGAMTFTDNNIQTNTQYCYRIKAVNGVLVSQYSETRCITTPPLPTAPSNLNATTVTNNSINITWWDNDNNEAGYILEYSIGGTTYTVWDTLPANTTNYTHTGLPNNTHFFYKVRTLAYNFVSAYSNIDDAYTQTASTNKQITKLEYYIDTDPGLNNGTDIPIMYAVFLDKNFTVNLTNVSDGLHTLYIRVKDNVGKWSQIYSQSFVKLAGTSGSLVINKIEYYIDTDPGLGNGVDVPVTNNDSINQNFNVNLSQVTNGLHTLYVRARDNQGKWSQIYSRPFVKLDGTSGVVAINKMEYYIDVDPGLGSGVDVPITANTSINNNFNVNLSTVVNGLHTLYVRVRDNQGKWSQIYSHSFLSTQGNSNPPTITQLEYYWDNDPGFGNALQIPVVPVASININGIISTANLSLGNHILYIRAKDSRNLWSHIYSSTIPIKLVADFTYSTSYLQVAFTNTTTYSGGTPTYSWNFGNGNTYIGANPPTQSFTSVCPQNICLTATLNGDTSTICKIISPSSPPSITASQTAICVGGTLTLTNNIVGMPSPYTRKWQSSPDGIVFTDIIPTAIGSTYTATLNTVGTYYYRLAISKAGQCSGYSNVTVVTVAPDPVVTATGSATVCGSGTATFTANPQNGVGTNTLSWEQLVNNAWGAAATAANPYTTPTLSATRSYRAKLVSTGNGCTTAYSSNVILTVNALPSVTTSPAASTTICTGGSRTITATGANSYAWTGANLNTTTGSTVIATPSANTTYTVVGTNTTTGCSKSVNMTVNVVADPTVAITGINSVCAGSNVTLTANVTGGTGTFSYLWQSSTNGTTFTNLGSATSSNIYLLQGLSTTKYYRVYLTCNGIGCTTPVYSAPFLITVLPVPQLTLSGTSTICTGGNTTLTANMVGGAGSCPFTWQKSTDGGLTWVSATTLATAIYTTSSLTDTTQFRVSVNCSGLGCGGATSNVLEVIVNPDPTVTATGNATVCGSGTATFVANPQYGAGNCTLTWEELGTAWTTVASNSTTYTTVPLSATKSYRAKLVCDGNGCGTAYSSNVTLTVNPLPTVTTSPSASTTICVGGTKTITASGTNTYSWYPATNLNTNIGATVIASPTSTTTYTVVGTNTATGCAKSVNFTVNVEADPTVAVSGVSAICAGGSPNLSSAVSGGTGTFAYIWQSSSNGTTFANVAGATASTYTPPAATATKYYRLYMTCNGTGCTSPVYSPNFQVNIAPMPQVTVSGATTICTGGTANLSANLTGGAGSCPFTWQKSTDNGATWTTENTTSNTTYSTPTLTTTTQYRAMVICNDLSCTPATSNVITITVNPDPTVTISGNASVCSGSGTMLSANVSGGVGTISYQWQNYVSLNNYSDIFVGGTNSTYSPTNLTTAKTYRVVVNAAGNGCDVANAGNFPISILTLPTVTLASTTSICEGGTRSLTVVGNAVSYSWASPNLNTYSGTTVIFTPTVGGVYLHTVYGTAANGCVKSASSTTNVVSDPVVSITGPSSIPINSTANLTANWTGGAGVISLKWQSRLTPTGTWTDISGSSSTVTGLTTSSYITPAFSGAQYFRAALYANASGCGGTGTTAAWVYSSDIAIIAQAPPSRIEKNQSLIVFPNPAQTDIKVQVFKTQDDALTLEITNDLGQLLMKWNGNVENGLYEKVISLEKYVEGIYYIRVSYSNGTFETIKFVKEGTNRD